MHESVFSRAAVPPTVMCLGMVLRPFSLGHYIALHSRGNPYVAGRSDPKRLPEAVLVCCHDWEELDAMKRDRWAAFKIKLWLRRARKLDVLHESEVFESYVENGSLMLPPAPERASVQGPQPRLLGAPFAARVEVFLRAVLRMSRSQAMDAEFGHAACLYQSWNETEGGSGVMNVNEAEVERQFAKLREEDEAKSRASDAQEVGCA